MPMTPPLRLVLRGYRSGRITCGAGLLFDRTPAALWGGPTVTVPTGAGDMTLPVKDHGARQLLVFGEIRHEREETRLFAALAPHLHRVIDVGANLGWYPSLLATNGLPDDASVIAVEPNPVLAPYLEANAARHSQVIVRRLAILDGSGPVSFFVSSNSALSSASRRVGTEHTVPGMTLDELVDREFDGMAPDFVKVDVEGGEGAVLAGSREVRNAERPPMWLMEVDGSFLSETGSSYAAIEDEIRSATMPVTLFFVDPDDRWAELPHLSDLRETGRVNVVVVPDCHRALFEDAVAGLH